MQNVTAADKRLIASVQQRLDTRVLWRIARRTLMVVIGGLIAGLGYSLFQVPFNLAAGGVAGIAIIINQFVDISAGTLVFLLNIPLLILGFFTLGRWRFLSYTLIAATVFAFSADFFSAYIPTIMDTYPITNDMLLSSVYTGVVVGIGSGLIYRAGSTMGGTSVTGRLIQRKTGLPLSQVYLYTDGAIIAVSGFVFGWESALHAMLALFIMGIASDFVMEGPSQVRSATIITDKPDEMSLALMQGLRQGVSHWDITGAYSGKRRSMLWCTVSRSQVDDLKYIVATVDSNAFVVIGQSHQALGGGFHSLKREIK